MKLGWKQAQLGDLAHFDRGLTYAKKDEVDFSSSVVLRANNITLGTNQLNFDEMRYISDSIEIPSSKRVRDGSILICTASGSKSHLGKAAIISGGINYAFGGFMGLITPNEQILSRYLYYFFLSQEYRSHITNLTDGTNINNLKWSQLSSFNVPLPPLEEQRRIVAILDESFERLETAQANAEANLASAEELFEANLDAVFNSDKHLEETASALWEQKTLGDISYVKSGGTPSKSKEQYWSGSIPWYSSGELNNRLTAAPNQMISQEGLDNSNAKIFAAGSLLIGIYDTAAMKMSILDRDAAFNQAIVGVLPGPDFSIDFLRWALTWMKPRLMNERRGTRQKNLSLSKIKEIQIPQPPLEEQDETVSKLNNMEDACKALQQHCHAKFQDIAKLRQSLLQKAFAGELT